MWSMEKWFFGNAVAAPCLGVFSGRRKIIAPLIKLLRTRVANFQEPLFNVFYFSIYNIKKECVTRNPGHYFKQGYDHTVCHGV